MNNDGHRMQQPNWSTALSASRHVAKAEHLHVKRPIGIGCLIVAGLILVYMAVNA
jgi:hypothetical protein